MQGQLVRIFYYAWRIGRWICIALLMTCIALVIYAYPHDHQEHLDKAAVANIKAQKLTIADVDASRLPPPPDPIQAQATIAGVDANDNGIRDDVELAIYGEYPTSTGIRAAELQYAMDLQIQLTQVVDVATWEAAIQQRERGFGCIYDNSDSNYGPFEKEVEAMVLNTEPRKEQFNSIERYRISYLLPSGPDCDVVSN